MISASVRNEDISALMILCKTKISTGVRASNGKSAVNEHPRRSTDRRSARMDCQIFHKPDAIGQAPMELTRFILLKIHRYADI